MTEETKGRENWVFAHIAWIASITWFVLVAVKALRVSHMNSQTAIAILGSAEVVSVAFYVLVAVIPSLFLLGTMWTLNWIAVPSPNRTAPQKALGICIVVLLSSVIVFIAPWFYPAIILVLLGVGLPAISLFRRWSRRRASRKPCL